MKKLILFISLLCLPLIQISNDRIIGSTIQEIKTLGFEKSQIGSYVVFSKYGEDAIYVATVISGTVNSLRIEVPYTREDALVLNTETMEYDDTEYIRYNTITISP